MHDRVLILSCSARKCAGQQPLPALERYDGPPFRLLRRYLSRSAGGLRVYVLSAEYGLIAGDQAIPDYDRRMTKERAAELRPQVTAALQRALAGGTYSAGYKHRVFISFGRAYYEAVSDVCGLTLQGASISHATGSPGNRLTQLHSWLYGMPPSERTLAPRRNVQGTVRLRGVEIALNAERAIATARRALDHNGNIRTGGETWYVKVGDARVGPKWLVSLMTDLPVGAFHTDEARRVLNQLGIEVHLDAGASLPQNSREASDGKRCI